MIEIMVTIFILSFFPHVHAFNEQKQIRTHNNKKRQKFIHKVIWNGAVSQTERELVTNCIYFAYN